MSADSSFISVLKCMKPFFKASFTHYEEKVNAFRTVFSKHKPDLILCDFFAEACIDTALMEGLNFGVLGPLGFQGFHDEWFIPSNYNPVSQSTWMMLPLTRAATRIQFALYGLPTMIPMDWEKKSIKRRVWGKEVPSPSSIFSEHLYISLTFFGFQPSLSLPPNVLALGPLLQPLPVNATRNGTVDHIITNSEIKDPRVVYIAFGSVASSFEAIAGRLFDAMDVILSQNDDVVVLWSCRDSFCASVVQNHVAPKNFERVYVRKWVDQRAVLHHPATKLFISHGGLSSSLESIYAGVPLIVVPLFGDQPINGVYVQDAGLGFTLKDKKSFTNEDLVSRSSIILNAIKFRNSAETEGFSLAKVQKLQALAQLQAEASFIVGANTIEAVARYGVNHLVPANVKISTWQMLGGTDKTTLAAVLGILVATIITCFAGSRFLL
ncbi:hypothetical protein HDU83_005387 [Entophlyctis luteolus]|nr:hypothetical protein HDU83_005387 [Entophlyctis luteolus]